MNIYMIENVITNKKYIGQTKRSIKTRFSEHIRTSKRINSRLSKTKFYDSIRQYGEDKFTITLLETVEDNLADEREKFWIEKFDTVKNGLNTSYGGKGKLFYNKNIEEKICELYNQGKDITDIVKEIDLCFDTIYKILQNNHIVIDKNRNQRKPIIMLDKQNNEIQTFSSYKEAFSYLISIDKIKNPHMSWFSYKINEVIKGKRITAYGFKWQKIIEGEEI